MRPFFIDLTIDLFMEYALITGASKGIGKAIAEELAKRKVNVLLVARSKILLEESAQYLSGKYTIQADYFATDLSIPGVSKNIFEWCREKNYTVNILINNAGFGLSGKLENHSLAEHLKMLRVNLIAVIELTYLFLPVLKTQQSSYIMNIASIASYQTVPGMNLYAAGKSFIANFSRGLRFELKHTSVSVTVVNPGAVDTGFINMLNIKGGQALRLTKMLNMKPGKVAAIAVKNMYAKKAEVIPGIINKISTFFVWLLPKTFSERFAAKIYDV